MIKITIDASNFLRKLENLKTEFAPLVKEAAHELMEEAYFYMNMAGNVPIFVPSEYSTAALIKIYSFWKERGISANAPLMNNLYYLREEDMDESSFGFTTGVGNIDRLDRLVPPHDIIIISKDWEQDDSEPEYKSAYKGHGHWYFLYAGMLPDAGLYSKPYFDDATMYITDNYQKTFQNVLNMTAGTWNNG